MAGPERVIGVRALGLTVVNVIVGVGIFGLPALAAANLGSAAVLAYLVCVVLVGVVGLCLAEAGSRVPGPGGLYAYADAAFGPLGGSFVGMLVWFASGAVSDAAIASFLTSTVATLVPFLATPAGRTLFLLAVFGILAGVNMRGTRGGAGLSELTTVIKLAPLVALIAFGSARVQPANLRWPETVAAGTVGQTAVLLFFAFQGLESALAISGEVRNPERTVPRAILLGLAIVAALYLGLQVVAQGVLGPELARATDAPLAETARYVFGDWGVRGLVAVTGVSALGCLAGDLLVSPRGLYALGRDGLLAHRLGTIHPRFHTPAVAIAAYALIALVLAASGTFRYLAIMSSAGSLMAYLIVCLGVLRLRARGVRGDTAPFVVGGGAVVPLMAATVILLLLVSLSARELLSVPVLALVAVLPYLLRGRLKSGDQRRG